ncbi:hypothetical protein N9P55_00040 [bacterium]|nr:hypothetical protein [bacterium]MDB4088261.1 hypothetical protein [Flavobacteriales bacterium]
MFKERLELYDQVAALCNRFERKGKTSPYTSANGYMFSFLNKAAELGFRFSKEVQENYFDKYETTYYKSHNSVMKGHILITDKMLEDKDLLVSLLNESYDYVMSLEPK